MLLKHGADVNIRDSALNTPLNVAVTTGGANSIDLLMEYGADISIPSFRGAYPVHKAMYRG